MSDDLRDRIRGSAGGSAPALDLGHVERRARSLRIRRAAAGATAALVLAAAIAIPLSSLNGLRTQRPQPAGTGEPRFGDGSVSFAPLDGWNTLQGGTLSACATTAAFAPADVDQSRHLGTHDLMTCRATASALAPDGVLIGGGAGDPYAWAEPNVNFPASPLPPVLDPSTCGANTYEGQAPGTTECHVWITANDRELALSVWFGTETPSDELMAEAQVGLDALRVSEPASLGNDIAFEPEHGWYDGAATPTSPDASFDGPSAWTANVPLDPPNGNLPAGPTNDLTELPSGSVIVWVEQWLTTRNALPDLPNLQPIPGAIGPDISRGTLSTGPWEGQAASDVSALHLSGTLGGRPVVVNAYFHTADPGTDLVRQAQFALNRLIVVPLPPPTTALDDFGISMSIPSGWNGWLFGGDPTLVATTSQPRNPFDAPDVAQHEGDEDTTIVVDESTDVQSLRWPAIDGPPQIGPGNFCVSCEIMDGGDGPDPGHALYHDTFTSGGRAFDLYVEFGAAPTAQTIDDVNATLSTFRSTPVPNPMPPPDGGTAVGSLYEGHHPAVTATSDERTLSWSDGGGSSLQVPAGWTGWRYLIPDPTDPINLYAFGSWNLPQGGYCAPLMALQQLPEDGVLVWIDRYGTHAEVAPSSIAPWPSDPRVGPGTDPAPAPTPCTAGTPVQSFTWTLGDRTYAVHVAWGSDVGTDAIAAAESSLASFTAN
jgi:hypothetical protein